MERFTFLSSDGKTALSAYRWIPQNPRAMMQISHGMCEYLMRYRDFAEYLTAQGILVFGHDHLGHGDSVSDPADLGFTASKGGAGMLIEDVHTLSLEMKALYPHLPLILFGHSMGSFITRAVLEIYGEDYAGSVICGTGGPETPAAAGKALASFLIKLKGERHRSRLLAGIAFAGYNKKYEKGCDKNAWLSRDAAVVEAYNKDPLCGYTFTLRAYRDLFRLVEHVSRPAWAEGCPKEMPLLVVSGEMDPVGNWGKGVRTVADRLQKAGCKDVTLTLYPEMRHEILNEIGREKVWSDIAQWIEAKL
jgi:alpha-beta hydrolase superfamily lysophospholipase